MLSRVAFRASPLPGCCTAVSSSSLRVSLQMEEHGDVVFAEQRTSYKSILFKTYFVLEHAARHYRAAFVLKTDDDAFVNVPALLIALKRM